MPNIVGHQFLRTKFHISYQYFYLQSEQKRFLQQHKLRSESYSKAAATIKKQRKKKTNVTKVGSAMDKEMKVKWVSLNVPVLLPRLPKVPVD